MRIIFGVVLLLTASAVGCEGRNPAKPTATIPTVASLAIGGPDVVLTGGSSNYTTSATLSDGTTRAVFMPAWSSSNPDVASVDITGRLDGRAHGTTTLTATYEGASAARTVRVVNNYAGRWAGTYVVTLCDGYPGFCMDYTWAAFSISLVISQTGNDLSATFRLPSVFPSEMEANIAGRVMPDGRLNLSGASDLTERNSGETWATFHVGAWDTTLSDGAAMTGRWAHRLSGVPSRSGPSFNGYQEIELLSMTRTP
jgi:hypothetical protein